MTSLAQRTWSAFSAEDRAERRALGGITLKMYDEDEVPLDHALRHWSYREFPRDLGHISKIYNGEVIGSYLEAGGNPDATLYGGTYTMLGLYLEEHVNSLVKLLLEHGADPNHRADGRSPHEIRHHPRENYELEYSCPPIIKAISEGNIEGLKLLLEYGADVEAAFSWDMLGGGNYTRGITPLIRARRAVHFRDRGDDRFVPGPRLGDIRAAEHAVDEASVLQHGERECLARRRRAEDHAQRPGAARLELFEPLLRRAVVAFRRGGRKRFLRVLLTEFQRHFLSFGAPRRASGSKWFYDRSSGHRDRRAARFWTAQHTCREGILGRSRRLCDHVLGTLA